MAKDHTIIFIHGMGSPDDAMFQKWEAQVAGIHDRYILGQAPFSDMFKCISINYNNIFESRRKSWESQIDTIMNAGADLPNSFPSQQDLESFTNDSFYTTHLMDVLLYRFDEMVANDVNDYVWGQIVDVIRNHTLAGGKVSIIAHSLGTAVLHNSVNVLYNTTKEEAETLFIPKNFRFHAIVQLANVSRTLETKWDAYSSYLRPGVKMANDGKYATTRMLSASHSWDPLVSLRRFRPVNNWPDPETVAKNRFVLVQPTIIQNWNTHDFSHYLKDPLVHIPMLRMLRTNNFIAQGQESDAIDAFHKANPIAKFDEHRKNLEKMLVGEADFSWKRLVVVFREFYKLLKEVNEK